MNHNFSQKHPYLSMVLLCLLCTCFTAIGSAIPQIIGLEQISSYLVMSLFIFLSALIGLLIMKKSKHTLSDYGFREFSSTSKQVLFYIPLIVIEIIPIAFFGFSKELSPFLIFSLAIFTIAVGCNEEIYFRGLALNTVAQKGIKKAIISTSVLFGILHIVNIFNGRDAFYVMLQINFAFLVGFVLSELLSITKSIWILIIWHTSHDFIAMITNDGVDSVASIFVSAVQVIILLLYAIFLWKRVKT